LNWTWAMCSNSSSVGTTNESRYSRWLRDERAESTEPCDSGRCVFVGPWFGLRGGVTGDSGVSVVEDDVPGWLLVKFILTALSNKCRFVFQGASHQGRRRTSEGKICIFSTSTAQDLQCSWAVDLFSCASFPAVILGTCACGDSNESNGAAVGLARCGMECQASLSPFPSTCQALATKNRDKVLTWNSAVQEDN
jgi:hypothetical protein